MCEQADPLTIEGYCKYSQSPWRSISVRAYNVCRASYNVVPRFANILFFDFCGRGKNYNSEFSRAFSLCSSWYLEPNYLYEQKDFYGK